MRDNIQHAEPSRFEILRKKRWAYTTVFNDESVAARIVLADLRRFTGAGRPINERTEGDMRERIGLQKVYYRILQTLRLTDEQIAAYLPEEEQ